MKKLSFFIVVTIIGIFLQSLFMGSDFFLPAILLILQNNNVHLAMITGLGWLLIQEGVSSLPFGSVFLVYIAFYIAFYWLKFYLKTQSFWFVLIMGCFCGTLYYFSISIIAEISNFLINFDILTKNFLLQIILFPCAWMFYNFLYKKYFSSISNIF